MPVMIRFDDNWADEMDISAMKIDVESSTVQEAQKKQFKGIQFPTEVYFGTNESNDYETLEQLQECYSFTVISDVDYKVLERLGLDRYGDMPTFYNREEDTEEDDIEDD